MVSVCPLPYLTRRSMLAGRADQRGGPYRLGPSFLAATLVLPPPSARGADLVIWWPTIVIISLRERLFAHDPGARRDRARGGARMAPPSPPGAPGRAIEVREARGGRRERTRQRPDGLLRASQVPW